MKKQDVIEAVLDWKLYPNALGMESRAATLVADVSTVLGEPIPAEVNAALAQLAARGTMRDIASELGTRDIAFGPGTGLSKNRTQKMSFKKGSGSDDLTVARLAEIVGFEKTGGLAQPSTGSSWGPALATVTRYLNRVLEVSEL
jgi:hypothetical protein